jgi:hypothetical protein
MAWLTKLTARLIVARLMAQLGYSSRRNTTTILQHFPGFANVGHMALFTTLAVCKAQVGIFT